MPPAVDRRVRRRTRRPRRRPTALIVIVLIGFAAVAAVVALAGALDDDRPHGPYLIGAWTFGHRQSLAAAVKADAVDEISVDWLQSRPNGTVTAPRLDTAFIAEAKRAGCRVFATLTDYNEQKHTFDPAISAAILASSETRRRHVGAVASWCENYGVAGVDVDWEAVRGSHRDTYSAFVEELARRLHDDHRFIAVDVYPKLKEPGDWDGPRAQDWARLGQAVDQFRVMTYNFSGSWSEPGPLSPPAWMDRVLTFAEEQVPAQRIVMGLGFYGRGWRGSRTTDLRWDDVAAIRAGNHPSEHRDKSGELSLEYKSDGATHRAFFPDAQAIRVKVHVLLSRHPHIRGVFAWLMGQEDPRVWAELHRALH